MKRAGKLATGLVLTVLVTGSSSGLAAGGTPLPSSTACESDPTGATCFIDETSTCGDLVTIDGTTVSYSQEAGQCYGAATGGWLCPVDSPCAQQVEEIRARCNQSGVCEEIEDICIRSGACDLLRETIELLESLMRG